MFTLKEKIIIHNAEDSTITYSIWKLMALPYTLDMNSSSKTSPQRQAPSPILPQTTNDLRPAGRAVKTYSTALTPSQDHAIEMTNSNSTETLGLNNSSALTLSRTETSISYQEHCITVQVIMPSNFGLRSWRTLETIIEVMAVGIYLYATFILMSLVFFTAQRATVFATQMAICLSFVRLIGLLF